MDGVVDITVEDAILCGGAGLGSTEAGVARAFFARLASSALRRYSVFGSAEEGVRSGVRIGWDAGNEVEGD